MSEAYSAIEAFEVDLNGAESVDDVRQALNTCRDAIDSVKDEYQNGFDSMPQSLQDSSTGEEIQAKIDHLGEFSDALDSAENDLEEFEDEEPDADAPEHEAWVTASDAALTAAKELAAEPELED